MRTTNGKGYSAKGVVLIHDIPSHNPAISLKTLPKPSAANRVFCQKDYRMEGETCPVTAPDITIFSTDILVQKTG